MTKKILYTFLGFSLLLTLWQLSSYLFPHLIFVLPPPSTIASTLIECRGRFLFHSLATIKEMIGGFAIATMASFLLAWTMLQFKYTRSLLQPLFIIIQCLPMFALAPLMILWCGWGYSAIILPTALMIFFPLTLNIYQGLRDAPEALLGFFRINGATKMQTLLKLQLPWALPHIFSGFRIAAAIAGIGAIGGEWAGAQKGLGILMLESRRNFDLDITFGALFCLTLFSTTLYGIILLLEYLITHRRYFKIPRLSLAFYFKKNSKKSFALPLLCSAIIFLCTSSCHKPHNQTKEIRLLLDWLPNQNHIPLYVGIELGYFKKEGILLSLQKMHECGGVLSYLTTNQVDLAIYHTPGTLRAQTKGAELKIVGALIQVPLRAFIYRDDPNILIPSDLSNKVLGYCIGGPDTTFLEFLLTRAEISPSAKRNVSVDLISAMGTKNVDFIYGGFWNIEPHLLNAFNVKTKYFKIEEMGVPPYDEMIILANKSTPYGQQPFVRHFQKALHKSILFCKQHPEKAFALYAKQNPDKRKKTLIWEEAAWQDTYPLLANNQRIDLDKLNAFYQWQLEEKILLEQTDPKLLIP